MSLQKPTYVSALILRDAFAHHILKLCRFEKEDFLGVSYRLTFEIVHKPTPHIYNCDYVCCCWDNHKRMFGEETTATEKEDEAAKRLESLLYKEVYFDQDFILKEYNSETPRVIAPSDALICFKRVER